MSKTNYRVEIQNFRVFEDASGVSCTATCNGFKFSCSWLGSEVNVHGLNEYGSARLQERSAAAVRVAVDARVMAATTAEWRAACTAMYAD